MVHRIEGDSAQRKGGELKGSRMMLELNREEVSEPKVYICTLFHGQTSPPEHGVVSAVLAHQGE
jgi:hypothetical protein